MCRICACICVGNETKVNINIRLFFRESVKVVLRKWILTIVIGQGEDARLLGTEQTMSVYSYNLLLTHDRSTHPQCCFRTIVRTSIMICKIVRTSIMFSQCCSTSPTNSAMLVNLPPLVFPTYMNHPLDFLTKGSP